MFAQKDDGIVNATVVGEQQGLSRQESMYKSKKQPNGCRDPLFALLFVANLGVIIGICARFGSDPFSNNNNNDNYDDADITSDDMIGFLYAAVAGGGISIVLSALMVLLMVKFAKFLIKAAIFFNIALFGLAVAFSLYAGAIGGAILSFIFFAIMCCYARAVWSRIPFATANLVTATKAIKSNCGVTLIGYLVVIVAFGWSILWCSAVLGLQHNIYTCETNADGTETCSNPNYGIIFGMALSFFFTQQVLKVSYFFDNAIPQTGLRLNAVKIFDLNIVNRTLFM